MEILYTAPALHDAAKQVDEAARETEARRLETLGILNSMADRFGGRETQEFRTTVASVNRWFADWQAAIGAAAQALTVVRREMGSSS